MRVTSNTATSIRSSMASLRGCAIGRIPRFTATCAPGCFRRIGRVTAKRTVISANEGDDGAVIVLTCDSSA